MINGLNIAASGLLTSMYRQDVAANNLANLETVGFKPDFASTMSRAGVAEEDGLLSLPRNRLLDRLGAGVLLAPNRVKLAQGSLEETGNQLNVALEGDGFLVARAGEGPDGLRLTRDGRLAVDTSGRLVLATSGLPVLDTAGKPVQVGHAGFKVESDGAITRDGLALARLRLARVSHPRHLSKLGQGLYAAPDGALAPASPATRVVQGAVERSGVDPIAAMMDVTSAASSVTSHSRLVQLYDELMGRTISTLGRVG
ncbi:MAG TPA: flagellar hook-basal body complex protein [Phycisphaerales bacterium]|nr:flagellar hook-basal body complex protein [Phycisphaerales bacterium]